MNDRLRKVKLNFELGGRLTQRYRSEDFKKRCSIGKHFIKIYFARVRHKVKIEN